MKISTKGRYALRVMIDLAQNADEKYISLKDVADSAQNMENSQDIPDKKEE